MRQSFSHSSCSLRKSLFPEVVDIPVVAQMQIPLVLFPQRFSSCNTLIRWSTSFVQVLQFSRADVERQLPQLQLVELRTGCCMPVVCNDKCRMVDDVAQFIDGFGCPCDHAET